MWNWLAPKQNKTETVWAVNDCVQFLFLKCLQKTKDEIASVIKIKLYLASTHNEPWGRLNKKDGLTRYGDSHVKDKTS